MRGFPIIKVVENSPQNARNCTIFINFLGGAFPQTHLATARSFATRGMYIQDPKNFTVGPPLTNPAYAPAQRTHANVVKFIFRRVSRGGGPRGPGPPPLEIEKQKKKKKKKKKKAFKFWAPPLTNSWTHA